MRIILCTAAWVALLPATAPPQEEKEQVARELATLRQEFQSLRASYEARLAQLESRLAALEANRPQPPPAAVTPAEESLLKEAAAALAPSPPPVAQPAPASTTGGAPQSLNPQMSVIGDFLASGYHNMPEFEGAALDLRGDSLPVGD